MIRSRARSFVAAVVRNALRRELAAGRAPDVDAAERVALEVADERPDIGLALDAFYPTRRSVRRLVARCLAEVAAQKGLDKPDGSGYDAGAGKGGTR